MPHVVILCMLEFEVTDCGYICLPYSLRLCMLIYPLRYRVERFMLIYILYALEFWPTICCWPPPAQQSLFPSPTGPVTALGAFRPMTVSMPYCQEPNAISCRLYKVSLYLWSQKVRFATHKSPPLPSSGVRGERNLSVWFIRNSMLQNMGNNRHNIRKIAV